MYKRQLFAPAITSARDGVPVQVNLQPQWEKDSKRILAAMEQNPAPHVWWRQVFLKEDGAPYRSGDIFRWEEYAQTLEEEPVDGGSHGGHDDHDDHNGHDHDSDEIEYDEHIWTSPVEAEKLCRAICDALCAADPAHAADFQANLAAYLQELSDLDADFRQVCREKKRDLLVFGDRFPLLYFCREYGLNYRAAFHGCSSDTEPSLYTLKFLIDKVREEQIPVVYALELSSQRVAEAIAETTGARVVTFYSCQTVSQADWAAGEGYLSLMRRNVAALREGIC